MKSAIEIAAGLGAIGFAVYQMTNPSQAVADVDTGGVSVQPNLNRTQQIAQYAANAGFSGDDLTVAVAIALAESSGRSGPPDGDQALAPTNGPSKGLWQINIGSRAHPEYATVDLYDPQTNANAAFEIYQNAGYSFRPWTTYKTQAYQRYMSTVEAVVSV